ncbi:MAG: dephospho-CoA kinase [Tissierellia bacterium]|nr:dephospho-CoA kinase [Tissierellia bacterium]
MKSKVIGITGSIATGKSVASELIRKKGFTVIDADRVAHQLMKRGEKNYQRLVDYYGDCIVGENGEIDRCKLGKRVFSNKEELQKLNELTHADIFNRILEMINMCEDKVVFIELPILFELLKDGKLGINVDEKWLIYTSPELQKNRLMKRNRFSEKEAMDRINSQISVDVKREMADVVIDNSKDLKWLESQIDFNLERL